MSKYAALWEHVAHSCKDSLVMTYSEIETVLGFPIDHAFLTYKKELAEYGCCMKKISMKKETVEFLRTEDGKC